MDQRHPACEIGVHQIGKVTAQLVRGEQPLINHRARGEAGDVTSHACLAGRSADLLARDVELGIERCLIFASRNEKLFDGRFTTPRLVTQNLAVDGYIAYRQQVEPLATDHRCGQIETSGTSRLVFGQKEDSHTVFALLGYRNSLQEDELVRDLNHHSGSIACFAIGTLGPAMGHVFQNLQSVFDDLVRLSSPHVDHQSHTARVMLIGRPIQSLLRLPLSILIHIHAFFALRLPYRMKSSSRYLGSAHISLSTISSSLSIW